MQGTENAAALLGRIAMSVIFILAGWGKLLAPAATQRCSPAIICRWCSSAGYCRRRTGRWAGNPVGDVDPSGWAGAGDMVRRHRPNCAYEFRGPQSGDQFLEKHGDDGRFSLRRGVRGGSLESRRVVVAPRRRSGVLGRSPRMDSGDRLSVAGRAAVAAPRHDRDSNPRRATINAR
jgi:hypothetical protein